MMRQHRVSSVRKAFTLIEMLVVLLIIGILAAILFPVLKQARESGYQAACATNLHQIYLAVELYRKDEGGYPGSLAALLPDTVELADGNLNAGGKGYFKGGADALIGPDDDSVSTTARSSYGDLHSIAAPNGDFGRYVWNYWGYRTVSDATLPNTATPAAGCDEGNVSECLGTAYQNEADFQTMITSNDAAVNPFLQNRFAIVPDGSAAPTAAISDPTNIDLTKIPRLANRFAPKSTIITHCVYHRLPTSNIAGNFALYDSSYPEDWQGAKDIILRLDGTAKVLDVSTASFAKDNAWALQNF